MLDATSIATRPPAVIHLRVPAPELMARAAHAGRAAPLSYAPVGATDGAMPPGFAHDQQAGVIGHGDAVWSRAKDALRRWAQFDMPWVRIHRTDVPLEPGAVVTFASRQLGVWALNVCRVVYVVDEADRFGVAYGTLDGHVVSGEERFLLRRDGETGQVTFEIRKYSRVRHPLVRLVTPAARAIQIRFSRDAIAALHRAVNA